MAALLATGLTNAELARRLYISPKTAAVHVSNILAKLGMTNRGRGGGVGGAHRPGPGRGRHDQRLSVSTWSVSSVDITEIGFDTDSGPLRHR